MPLKLSLTVHLRMAHAYSGSKAEEGSELPSVRPTEASFPAVDFAVLPVAIPDCLLLVMDDGFICLSLARPYNNVPHESWSDCPAHNGRNMAKRDTIDRLASPGSEWRPGVPGRRGKLQLRWKKQTGANSRLTAPRCQSRTPPPPPRTDQLAAREELGLPPHDCHTKLPVPPTVVHRGSRGRILLPS